MGKDLSIMFKCQDELTKEIQKMRASVKDFGKDVQSYQEIQKKAFGEKAELQLDFRKAKDELKELAKLEKDGVQGSKEAYISKQEQINQMSEGIKKYNQVINEANKAEKELTTTKSRNSNNPNLKPKNEVVEFGQNLVKAGMAKELGQSFSNAAGTYLTSAYGEKFGNRVGTVASNVLSDAITGFVATGGNPIGAVGGAVVGAVKSGLDIYSEEQKTKDGFFKGGINDIMEQAKALRPDVNKSIQLSGQRELDLISFETIFGGKKNAEKFLKDSDKFAQSTPFNSEEINQNAKIMKVYGWRQDEIFDKLEKTGDTSASLGLSSQDQNMVVTVLGRMKATNKTSAEFMNQLTSRGIDAVGLLAKSMGISVEKVRVLLDKGAITGEKASNAIINEMGKENKGAMSKMSKTYNGLMSTKEDTVDNNLREGGKFFTDYRAKFLPYEIDWEAKHGKQIARNENALKAKMETDKNAIINRKLEEVHESAAYLQAEKEKNYAEMGRQEKQAETEAIIDFNNSPEMKTLQENELANLKSTQEYLRKNGGFVELAQDIAEQFNQGWASKINLQIPNLNMGGKKGNTSARSSDFSDKPAQYIGRNMRRATGGRIEADYTPSLLDKNERVLTANENLEWERNKSKSNNNVINININNSNNNNDELADVVAFKITQALENLA